MIYLIQLLYQQKQGKLTYSSMINIPIPLMLTIKDDIIAGLKINFPDSLITFDNVKNIINVDWTLPKPAS